MPPLRIAYVLNVFPKLSETFIATELAGLRARGVEVRILSLRLPDEEPRHDIVERAELLAYTSYDLSEFKCVLRDFQPQLIHAHFARQATACARELAAELGLPFTFTAHRYDIYDKAPADFAARAAAAAALITVSEANARYIATTFGVPISRIQLIPCGVDTQRFSPSVTSTLDLPPIILCVARLKPVKNQELLLRACARLKTVGIPFRCVLVGDGPTRDNLLFQIAQLGLEANVELAGPADQYGVLEWLRQATVVALSSHSEGMPVCLMEAASCGLPTVATAVSGVPELIEDGVTGFVIPPGDEQALAAALARIISDRDLAARMGKAARLRALERFSVGLQINRLLALWTKILEQEVVS
ncbi:MAG: glycosyltransferase family 4 protein [Gammaproteobacteria bacterium]